MMAMLSMSLLLFSVYIQWQAVENVDIISNLKVVSLIGPGDIYDTRMSV